MRLRHSLGYRISVEESVEGGPQLADSLSLIDRLIDTRVTYIHASLSNALYQKPETEQSDASIVSILRDHIGNRVPLIAAGRISPSRASLAGGTGNRTLVGSRRAGSGDESRMGSTGARKPRWRNPPCDICR